MAKGVEDTAFYRYARLLALNDVGGDPSRFGIAVETFHEANALRAERWPNAMVTLQTHDTKRSADVRARLAALSWMPGEWAELARAVFSDTPPPDAHDGYLMLQTVVAAPIAADRIAAYTHKALRERKVTSNWIEPDEAHEAAVARWATALLERDDVRAFTERLAVPGRQIALAQKLLQLTSPGIPDIYQGDEDDFLALVDPDNRRPVRLAATGAAHAVAVAQARADARRARCPPHGQRGLRTRAGRRRRDRLRPRRRLRRGGGTAGRGPPRTPGERLARGLRRRRRRAPRARVTRDQPRMTSVREITALWTGAIARNRIR